MAPRPNDGRGAGLPSSGALAQGDARTLFAEAAPMPKALRLEHAL
jgi:hypothetical protein